MAANVGSRRVLEKSGLILVRTFADAEPVVIRDAGHDHVEYALSRADWKAGH